MAEHCSNDLIKIRYIGNLGALLHGLKRYEESLKAGQDARGVIPQGAASSARPPLDRTKTILGSPMTAPSRMKSYVNRDLIVIVRLIFRNDFAAASSSANLFWSSH